MRRFIGKLAVLSPISSLAYCDSNYETPDLITQADELKKDNTKLKTPMQFENLKNVLNQTTVHSYDGFRCQVSKQLIPEVAVQHL